MKDIGLILGIRPDVIRASKILKLLNQSTDIDFDFIWSGQHYSENMKDVPNLVVLQNIASFKLAPEKLSSLIMASVKSAFLKSAF